MDQRFCKHLRTKKMYIEATPEAALAEGTEAEFAPCHFWCNLTQGAAGPDDQPVHKHSCNNPSRSCYEE